MTDLLTREEVRDDELLSDEDGSCIYCQCRPAVSFCGRYQEGPIGDEEWDDEEMCPECLHVLDSTGCPSCGCGDGECCQLCDTPPAVDEVVLVTDLEVSDTDMDRLIARAAAVARFRMRFRNARRRRALRVRLIHLGRRW